MMNTMMSTIIIVTTIVLLCIVVSLIWSAAEKNIKVEELLFGKKENNEK